jgi:hypothetical protein
VEEILGSMHFTPGESSRYLVDVETLYELASREAARSIYAEIIDSIKFSVAADADVVQKVPPVKDVSSEQATRVLKKMAGRWQLDFSRGKETVRIEEDGSVFSDAKANPKFHLVVLAVNDATGAVEVAKDTADGRRVQIEHLTITPDSMTGHAKHDGHRLNYKRIKG